MARGKKVSTLSKVLRAGALAGGLLFSPLAASSVEAQTIAPDRALNEYERMFNGGDEPNRILTNIAKYTKENSTRTSTTDIFSQDPNSLANVYETVLFDGSEAFIINYIDGSVNFEGKIRGANGDIDRGDIIIFEGREVGMEEPKYFFFDICMDGQSDGRYIFPHEAADNVGPGENTRALAYRNLRVNIERLVKEKEKNSPYFLP